MSPRRTAPGCQIKVYHQRDAKLEATHCGKPLAPGSRWCEKHTREAKRLGGRWKA